MGSVRHSRGTSRWWSGPGVIWRRVQAISICFLAVVSLLQFAGDGGQNTLHIAFLVEGDSLEATNLSQVLRAWSENFFNASYSIDVRWDLQPLDTSAAFQSHLQASDAFKTHNISVVVPDKCSTLAFLFGTTVVSPDPIFTLAPFSCLKESLVTSHGFPSQFSLFAAVIRDVLLQLQWRDVIVFYDDSYGDQPSIIAHTIPELRFRQINVTGLVGNRLLDKMAAAVSKFRNTHHYIVSGKNDTINAVMEQAGRLETHLGRQGLISYHSRWLVVGEEEYLTSIKAPPIGSIPHVALLYWKNEAIESITTSFIVNNLETLGRDIMEYLSNGTLSQTTCFLRVDGLQYCDSFHLVPHSSLSTPVFELAAATSNLTEADTRVFTVTGQWSEGQGLVLQDDIFPLARYGFNGRQLRVAIRDKKLFVQPSGDVNQSSYRGFCIEMLEDMAILLNFTYTFVRHEEGGSGMMDEEEHRWTGLVGMLIDKQADIVVSPIAINNERQQVIDFSYPYFMDYYSVLYKRIDPATKKWRLFIEPFRWQVWMCIFLAVPTAGLAMFVVSRFSPFYSREERRTGLGTFAYCFFFSYGSLIQQSGVHEPKSLSGRFVVGFWWFFCVAIVATYTGNLIAFLTVSIEFPPFKSLSGMVSSGVPYGFEEGTVFHALLRDSNIALYESMRKAYDEERKVEHDSAHNLTDSDAHIRRVLSGNYAFIGDKTTLSVAEWEYCGQLAILADRIISVQYAIAFPKDSTLVDTFSNIILQFHENGLFDTWKQRYWNDKRVCSNERNMANAVTLVDFQGPVYVFFTAIIISFVGLAGELLFYRYKTNNAVSPRGVKPILVQPAEPCAGDGELEKKMMVTSVCSGLNRDDGGSGNMSKSETMTTDMSELDDEREAACAPVYTT